VESGILAQLVHLLLAQRQLHLVDEQLADSSATTSEKGKAKIGHIPSDADKSADLKDNNNRQRQNFPPGNATLLLQLESKILSVLLHFDKWYQKVMIEQGLLNCIVDMLSRSRRAVSLESPQQYRQGIFAVLRKAFELCEYFVEHHQQELMQVGLLQQLMSFLTPQANDDTTLTTSDTSLERQQHEEDQVFQLKALDILARFNRKSFAFLLLCSLSNLFSFWLSAF
jgi:hypothetical protein